MPQRYSGAAEFGVERRQTCSAAGKAGIEKVVRGEESVAGQVGQPRR